MIQRPDKADADRVEMVEGRFLVDAALIAAAFDLPEDRTRALMQDGTITSRTERGEGEDEGRFRLTFFHRNRAFRLTLDAEGRILTRAGFDVPPTRHR